MVAQAPVQSRRGFASPVPVPRPAGLSRQTSGPAYSQPAVAPVNASARAAALCGVRDIRGQKLGRIPGQIAGCGVTEPVQVTELAGVRLSRPAVVDCTTAKTLRNWVEKDAKPVIGRLGGGLAELQVAASYACRPRNNQPGAKISEHGKGHAVDIAALRLRNGMVLSVQSGWNDPVQGKLLRRLHSSACGPFGTVLGPESDRFHKDHFHFDTARYRSGSYCR
ncbi:extensin family protein [Celeribacter neptunius]|uniref:extensin-like domain-containing protein n=1 Tax=Celeribacter neptunius TaxID=588602 RepID=UPI001FE9844F|nr:extensin family protein [Celeribacter neptunius]